MSYLVIKNVSEVRWLLFECKLSALQSNIGGFWRVF
ncbi:MAG: hypothetical protein ACI8WB_005823, partial [Phenylobacterium sp.]